MTGWFPADCSPVSGTFRNTTFICLAPSAAPLRCALTRRAGAWVLLLRLLRCAPRSLAGLAPGPCSFGCSAALRAHSPGWRLGLAPSAAPLRSALTRRAGAWALLLRLLRCAPRSLAGLRPGLAPSMGPLRCPSLESGARSAQGPMSLAESVRARFHKRRDRATLAGAAAQGLARPAPSIPDLSVNKELASA